VIQSFGWLRNVLIHTNPLRVAKIKLTQEQYDKLQGTAAYFLYKQQGKFYVQDIDIIRRLAKAKKKAKKFVVRVKTEWGKKPLYIHQEGFTHSLKDAMQFAHGFDDPFTILKKWEEVTQLKLTIS
jgi:hypothetical protein